MRRASLILLCAILAIGSASRADAAATIKQLVGTCTNVGTTTCTITPGVAITAGDALVVATGTSFSVRSYPEDSATTVVVSEGKVEVRQGTDIRSLDAGSAVYVGVGVAPRLASPSERDDADAWRNGNITITNRQLRDVLPELKRWYNLDIKVPEGALLARKVTLRASLDSSRQAIRGVEQSAGLRFDYDGPTMIFRDATSPVTPTRSKK